MIPIRSLYVALLLVLLCVGTVSAATLAGNISDDAYFSRVWNDTFTNHRNAANDHVTVQNTPTTQLYALCTANTTTPYIADYRVSVITLDTRSLSSDATVTAGTITGYVSARSGSLGSMNLTLIDISPISGTGTIDSTDFNRTTFTPVSDELPYSAFATPNATVTWTLNAAGRAAINKGGNTSFALVSNWTVQNLTNTPSWSSGAESRLSIRSSAYGGGIYTPSFSLTYSSGPTAPIAAFTKSDAIGNAPDTIFFTDTSTGSPTGWNWSYRNATGDNVTYYFGDNVQNPAFNFNYTGNYSVSLISSNANGNSTPTAQWVNISASLPNIGHPRLYFNASTLAAVQARTTNPDTSAYWDDIYSRANTYNSFPTELTGSNNIDVLYGLRLTSFVYAVNGSAEIGAKGKSWLMNITRTSDWSSMQGHTLDQYTEYPYELSPITTGVAEAYDMLYPLLNTSERAEVQRALIQQGGMQPYDYDYWSGNYVKVNGGTNRGMRGYSAAGLAALAIYNDTSNQSFYTNYTTTLNTLIQNCADNFDRNGSWNEGVGYQSYGLADDGGFIFYADANERINGVNPLTQYPNFSRTMNYLIYSLPPDKKSYGDGFNDVQPSNFFSLAAIQWFVNHGDGLAQWYYQNAITRNYVDDEIGTFLWFNSTTPATDPNSLDKEKLFPDHGIALIRSGYGVNDTLLGFYSGNLSRARGMHYRPEQNGFFLDALGEKLIVEAGIPTTGTGTAGYSTYNSWTLGQNTLLVDGAGNSQWNYTMTGGATFRTNPQTSIPAGKIIQWKTSPSMVSVTGDAARVYNSTTLTKYNRSLAYAKTQNYTVLYDDLGASSPAEFDNLFHTFGSVAMGNISVTGNNITITQPSASLYMHILSPASINVTVIDAPVTSKVNATNKAMVYAKIKPTNPSTSEKFVIVMYPSTTGDLSVATLHNTTSDIGSNVTINGVMSNITFNKTTGDATFEGGTSATIPTASFTKNASIGVQPVAIQFTDTSTNTPTQWNWSFGDGTWDNETQNPLKSFATGGNYSITLTASNAAGSDTTDIQYVEIWNATSAEFSGAPTTGLQPLEVTFTDSSANATAWDWNFGDGSANSTDQNPVHIYSTGGTYTVFLNASNGYTSDTETKVAYIEVWNSTTAGFSANATSGNAPLGILFTDSSSNATGWTWSFGDDEGLSYDQNPVHTFTGFGIYSINLTVNNTHSEDFEYKQNYITVYNTSPVASFTSEPPTEGNAPLTIAFFDTSSNSPATWNWSFGDGQFSELQEPTHEYTTFGIYDVNLTVTNDGGSSYHLENDYVTVYNTTPIADLLANATSGCVPQTVQFTDNSTGTVHSWSWKLNGVEFSTEQNPTYEFTVPGIYEWLNLTVTNDGGINTVSWQDSFFFIDCAPDPITGLTNDTGTCEQVTFDWTNPTSANFNYTYVMRDGVFDQNVSNLSSSVTWAGLTGGVPISFNGTTVSILGNMSGSWGNQTATPTACGVPPVASFTKNTTGGVVPLSVAFTNTSTNTPTIWNWSFGDGNWTNGTTQNPDHTYDFAGTFNSFLIVSNTAGSNQSANQTVTITSTPPPVAAFTATADGSTVTFTNTSSGGVITGLSWAYNNHATPGWTQFSTAESPVYTFPTGIYDINLTVSGAGASDDELKSSFVTIGSGWETPVPGGVKPVVGSVDTQIFTGMMMLLLLPLVLIAGFVLLILNGKGKSVDPRLLLAAVVAIVLVIVVFWIVFAVNGNG